MTNKKILTALIISIIIMMVGCSSETEEKNIIRVADNVPALITPGVWDGQAFSMNCSIYEYLVELDANTNELIPSLAKEWSTPDGQVWTIKIQEGVKFHDGSDFTSEDVRFSIERTQDPAVGHLQQKDFAIVDKIETPDDFTVILHLADIRPTFIYLLTAYNMTMLSSDYDYAALGETKPMGTGAFKMAELRPKESALLVKNEDYWVEGLPKADELRIYFVPDIDASMNMLEAGTVDIATYATVLHKNRLEAAGFNVISPFQEYRFVALSADRAPFDDNRVRLAMKYCIDPEILAASCQGELGVDVFYNETAILDNQPQHHEIPFRGRDIEKAKELLAEAGYPDGVTIDLYYGSDHPFGKELTQTIKELAAPAGFDIQLKGFTRDVYLSQYWMNAPMLLTGWGGRVDPSMLLMLAYHSTGPWNESHMNDAKVDELITKILAEVDDAERLNQYAQLAQVFHERGTVLNIQVPYYVAMRKEVKDYGQPMTLITQYKYTYITE